MIRRTTAAALWTALTLAVTPAFLGTGHASNVPQPQNLGAVAVDGVEFVRTLQARGTDFTLAGAGLHRYRIVFRGYAAALYLGTGATSGRVFDDIPKRLEIEYYHAIPAADFIDATHEGIERNVAPAVRDRIAARAKRLFAIYRSVRPGDRYAFTYVPGRGSSLELNGEELGVFDGLDFANAFLSIWVGANPADQVLKRALLGRK